MTQIGSITDKVLSSHKQIIETAAKTLGNDNNINNFGEFIEEEDKITSLLAFKMAFA